MLNTLRMKSYVLFETSTSLDKSLRVLPLAAQLFSFNVNR